MNLTRSALRYPAGVAVIVAVVMLFGAYSLRQLPVQLFPDIENPQIAIQTSWRAASPREIESEIIEPIESVLRGLPAARHGRLRQCWQRLDRTGVCPRS